MDLFTARMCFFIFAGGSRRGHRKKSWAGKRYVMASISTGRFSSTASWRAFFGSLVNRQKRRLHVLPNLRPFCSRRPAVLRPSAANCSEACGIWLSRYLRQKKITGTLVNRRPYSGAHGSRLGGGAFTKLDQGCSGPSPASYLAIGITGWLWGILGGQTVNENGFM